jgi:DNA-binding transcriptional MerR regulator
MKDHSSERPLRAGELARQTGVSKDALRFYERQGLLSRPERLPNNYRVYQRQTVERVQWLRRVLAAGFTVEELSGILAERERGGIPCRQVRDLGAVRLAQIEERLRDLELARNSLRSLLEDWDRRLAAAGPGERAGLLDSLPPEPPRKGNSKRKVEMR